MPANTEVDQNSNLEHLQSEAAVFLASVKLHQEALWAVLCHGRIVVSEAVIVDTDEKVRVVHIYRPTSVGNLNVAEWWETWNAEIGSALEYALHTAFPGWDHNHIRYTVDETVPVPDELADFAAKNSNRPIPSRFLSTAVVLQERDGITWLTPPEWVLYDRLKAAGWTFVPQPAVVLGDDEIRIPDFLIFWGGRAQQALFVEVDSDTFHSKPSQRERDEGKRRRFQALGFEYLPFAAKSCLHEPMEVIEAIKTFCVTKWGANRV
jgi:hypothetical protein